MHLLLLFLVCTCVNSTEFKPFATSGDLVFIEPDGFFVIEAIETPTSGLTGYVAFPARVARSDGNGGTEEGTSMRVLYRWDPLAFGSGLSLVAKPGDSGIVSIGDTWVDEDGNIAFIAQVNVGSEEDPLLRNAFFLWNEEDGIKEVLRERETFVVAGQEGSLRSLLPGKTVFANGTLLTSLELGRGRLIALCAITRENLFQIIDNFTELPGAGDEPGSFFFSSIKGLRLDSLGNYSVLLQLNTFRDAIYQGKLFTGEPTLNLFRSNQFPHKGLENLQITRDGKLGAIAEPHGMIDPNLPPDTRETIVLSEAGAVYQRDTQHSFSGSINTLGRPVDFAITSGGIFGRSIIFSAPVDWGELEGKFVIAEGAAFEFQGTLPLFYEGKILPPEFFPEANDPASPPNEDPVEDSGDMTDDEPIIVDYTVDRIWAAFVNGNGTMVVYASIKGPDVTQENRQTIWWFANEFSRLEPVLRTGDPIELRGETRTISGFLLNTGINNATIIDGTGEGGERIALAQNGNLAITIQTVDGHTSAGRIPFGTAPPAFSITSWEVDRESGMLTLNWDAIPGFTYVVYCSETLTPFSTDRVVATVVADSESGSAVFEAPPNGKAYYRVVEEL